MLLKGAVNIFEVRVVNISLNGNKGLNNSISASVDRTLPVLL